jgi:hypothetical protein
MRLSALSCLALGLALLGSFQSVGHCQTQCKCRPSPPGGTTRCEKGEVAICSNAGGECSGTCVRPPRASADQLVFSAALLSTVLKQQVTTQMLRSDPITFAHIMDALIRSNQTKDTVSIEYRGRNFQVSVALDDADERELEANRKLLRQ